MQNLQIENIKPGDKICTIMKDGKATVRKAQEDKEKQPKENLKEMKVELKALLNKYNASIEVYQTSGDDQGVEFESFLTIGNQSINIG